MRVLHDGITDGVYGAVRLTGTAILDAATTILRQAERSFPTAAAGPHRERDLLIGAVAGVVGDHAAVRRNPLMPRLGFYRDGRRVEPRAAALAQSYADATPRLAIFVHGLACTEHGWDFYRDPARPDTTPYGTRLAAGHGYTPLYVRYNTGLPIDADMVLDVRFLPNPHWVDELRPLTGEDSAVRDYIGRDQAWAGAMDRLEALLIDWIPRYWAAGKSYLTVAFGCTGGRHRSVAAAVEMANRLRGADISNSADGISTAGLRPR